MVRVKQINETLFNENEIYPEVGCLRNIFVSPEKV